MPSALRTVSVNIGGLDFKSKETFEQPGLIAQALLASESNAVPAAKTGTLSTRTDNNTGVLTMQANHGIANAAVVDVYWSTGKRYGMTVTNVATNLVSIDGGNGDNLPAQSTAITAIAVRTIDVDFNANLISIIQAQLIHSGSDKRGTLVFFDGSNSELLAINLANDAVWGWSDKDAGANPLAGHTVAYARISQAASDGAADLRMGALYDSA